MNANKCAGRRKRKRLHTWLAVFVNRHGGEETNGEGWEKECGVERKQAGRARLVGMCAPRLDGLVYETD